MDSRSRQAPAQAARRQALAGRGAAQPGALPPVALLAAASLATGPGGTQAAPAPLLIRYGGDAAFAPFESLDAQGRPTGFQVDLLAALGREISADIRIELQPWAQTEAAFRAGTLDLVAMVDTAERRQWALFAHGHASPALGVYHRREDPEPQALGSLAGQAVAVLDSPAMRDTLATALQGLQARFQPHPDAAQALAAVQQGQADLALLPRAYADPVLAQRVTPALRTSRLNLQAQPYALAVAPGQDALLARVQRGLHTLERSGELEALRLRWLSSHREAAATQRLEQGLVRQREWTWGVTGAAATVLGLMAWKLRQRSLAVAAEKRRRRSAEAALVSARDLLDRVFSRHPDPMLLVQGADSQVQDANGALLQLLGVGADALIGQTLPALGQHLDAAALAQLVQQLDEQGELQAAPLQLRRADGSARHCLVSAQRLNLGGQSQVLCILRDITEQLLRDTALRAGYQALAEQRGLQAERLAEALAAARAEGTRAKALLQDHTRALAHGLRQPLLGLQGFNGLLRQRLEQGHVQEALACSQQIDRATRRLSDTVGALSELAQVGERPLLRQPVDMQRLARATWNRLRGQEPSRSLGFDLASLPPAQADPALVSRLWEHLLGNACKFTRDTPTAKLRVDSHADARGTWYRITDNGAGFDMARAQRLFQPFQRLHPASRFDGLGMGLALVHRIVEHHGGDLRVRSAPGVGTVAEFTLGPTDPAPPG